MNFSRFFNYQTNRISVAAIILAASHLISRILGLIRDWLLAKNFGASAELDVYFTAFKIPDFIFVFGGVVAVFLPLFSEYFSRDEKEAWGFASNCLNVFLLLLTSLSLLFFIFAPFVLRLIVPGFTEQQLKQAIILTRVLLLTPIFFNLSSILTGILHYFNRFLIYSFCPIVYNLAIIFGIVFLSPFFGILGIVMGVVLGAFFHFLIQVPSAIDCGLRYKLVLNFKDSKIREVFFLLIPRMIGVAANQVNLIVVNAIASTLVVGSISIFSFVNNLQYFPIAIVGISSAVAVFPKLSKTWAEDKKDKFLHTFSLAFRQISYLIVPISILIFILRSQIVDFILGHGQFSVTSAKLASAILGVFCFGVLFSSLIPLLFRAFFSFKDTKTPNVIVVIFVIVNIALSLILTQALGPSSNSEWGIVLQDFFRKNLSLYDVGDISVLGLVLAFSISVIFEFILFIIFIKKRIGDFKIKEIVNSFSKVLIGAIAMMIALHFTFFKIKAIDSDVYQIMFTSLIGFSVYFFTTFFLGSREINVVKSLFFDRFLHRIRDHEQY